MSANLVRLEGRFLLVDATQNPSRPCSVTLTYPWPTIASCFMLRDTKDVSHSTDPGRFKTRTAVIDEGQALTCSCSASGQSW